MSSLTGAPVTGTLATNGDAVAAAMNNAGTAAIELSGTWTGTVTFKGLVGSTFVTIYGTPLGGGPAVSTATANGTWLFSYPGLSQIEATATAAMTGSAVVAIGISPAALADTSGSSTSAPVAATAGGATPYQLISANSNNATSLKNSAGQVYSIQAYNFSTSAAAYLKFYDKASAPSPGSDTPLKTVAIPQAVSTTQSSAIIISGPYVGIAFSSGIAFAIVANLAVNDNTSIAANAVLVNIDYH